MWLIYLVLTVIFGPSIIAFMFKAFIIVGNLVLRAVLAIGFMAFDQETRNDSDLCGACVNEAMRRMFK